MAYYYCDTGLTTGLNDGSSFDNAYQSIKTAMERASYGPGDILWIRRRSTFSSPTSNIVPAPNTGTRTQPVRFVGWPRTTHSVLSSDWTVGSTAVTIDDANMTRGHLGRYITAPNGRKYLITRVVSASSVMIDREYSGPTVTNQPATINADEDYALAQAIDDAAWTVKKANWNGDLPLLPVIDFQTTAYFVAGANGLLLSIAGLDFRGSTTMDGSLRIPRSPQYHVRGCLFSQVNAYASIAISGFGNVWIDRCVLDGGNLVSPSCGLYSNGINPRIKVTNSAIYGYYRGIVFNGIGLEAYNLNVGVEVANASDDIRFCENADSYLFDVKCGGTNGALTIGGGYGYVLGGPDQYVRCENFGKVLGASRMYPGWDNTHITRVNVVAGSGDPYKRTGGANSVVLGVIQASSQNNTPVEYAKELAKFRFWADTSSRNYRVYVQLSAIASLTPVELFLEAEYIDSYNDDTAYTMTKVTSNENLSLRTGPGDWTQYIEVTGIKPAAPGWVTLRVLGQWYDADGSVYIDPKVQIT